MGRIYLSILLLGILFHLTTSSPVDYNNQEIQGQPDNNELKQNNNQTIQGSMHRNHEQKDENNEATQGDLEPILQPVPVSAKKTDEELERVKNDKLNEKDKKLKEHEKQDHKNKDKREQEKKEHEERENQKEKQRNKEHERKEHQKNEHNKRDHEVNKHGRKGHEKKQEHPAVLDPEDGPIIIIIREQ